MTPKEKAIELVYKMYNSPYVQEIEAKRCALVAVDLVLGTFFLSIQDGVEYYWMEVKKEIQAL